MQAINDALTELFILFVQMACWCIGATLGVIYFIVWFAFKVTLWVAGAAFIIGFFSLLPHGLAVALGVIITVGFMLNAK